MHQNYHYENFDFDINSGSLSIIIWGMCIGILIGVLGSIVCRIYSSRIIKSLIKEGATDESSAKTLAELGLGKQWMVRRMLRAESSLRRSVLIANEAEFKPKASGLKVFWYEKFLRDEIPVKLDYAAAKFYLPEEKRISAELRYKSEGHPILSFIIAAVGLIAAAFFASAVIPELLQMLDNFITTVKPESNFL